MTESVCCALIKAHAVGVLMAKRLHESTAKMLHACISDEYHSDMQQAVLLHNQENTIFRKVRIVSYNSPKWLLKTCGLEHGADPSRSSNDPILRKFAGNF